MHENRFLQQLVIIFFTVQSPLSLFLCLSSVCLSIRLFDRASVFVSYSIYLPLEVFYETFTVLYRRFSGLSGPKSGAVSPPPGGDYLSDGWGIITGHSASKWHHGGHTRRIRGGKHWAALGIPGPDTPGTVLVSVFSVWR